MKKTLLAALALCSVLCLNACVGEKPPVQTTDAPVSSDTVPAVTTAEPVITTAEPAVTTAEPIATTAEPTVTTEATTVTTAKPVTTATEPPETTAAPETTLPAETEEPAYTGPFDLSQSDLSEYILLGKYLGIEVFVTEPEAITDADVEEKVQTALDTLPDEAMLREGVAELGNTVNIDYVGKIDGELFDGGSASGQKLTLGAHMFIDGFFIDGFEEGVVGMAVGETRTLELTFPADYYPEVAGKAVTFDVTLNAIYPALTDAIASTYLGAADAQSYRAEILAELENARAAEFAMAKEEAAWTKALANSLVVAYPEELLDREFEDTVAVYASLAEMYGLAYEDLFPLVYGLPVEEAETILMENAKNVVSVRLLLYAIARDMGIDTSDARFEEDLAAYVKMPRAVATAPRQFLALRA